MHGEEFHHSVRFRDFDWRVLRGTYDADHCSVRTYLAAAEEIQPPGSERRLWKRPPQDQSADAAAAGPAICARRQEELRQERTVQGHEARRQNAG